MNNFHYDINGNMQLVNNSIKEHFFLGRTGPTGPTGPIGKTGPAGPQGIPGPVNTTGLTGLIGLTGPTGPQGISGPIGPQGLIGPIGPQGIIGPIGPMGPQGMQGSTGIGLKGDRGDKGEKGDKGERGETGPIGISEFIFDRQSATLYYIDDIGNQNLVIDNLNTVFKGPTGPQGIPGPTSNILGSCRPVDGGCDSFEWAIGNPGMQYLDRLGGAVNAITGCDADEYINQIGFKRCNNATSMQMFFNCCKLNRT